MRLCITAALYTVTKDATRENKHINNLVDGWENNENTHDYIIRIQNNYNINIWFYKPSTEDDTKVEILERSSNFIKDCKNVRILVWNEQVALIKNIQVLLE